MSLQGHDPRTGEPVGQAVDETSREQVGMQADAAARAFANWSGVSRTRRAEVLVAIADALDAAAPELVKIANAETALGEPRLRGEVGRTSGQLRLFAKVAREGGYVEAILDAADPSATPPRPDLRRMLQPLGPVAVFGASNFPFAFSVLGGDTASALASGCTVVAKAHPAQPGTAVATAAVVERALRDAGIDAGVFSIVHGQQAGVDLVTHPAIRAVGFTGSTAGGRALFDLAQQRPDPIPFYGELGSLNPVLILPAAAAGKSAELANGFAASLTLGVGQFCTNPGLLIAPQSLLPALAEAVSGSSGGPMLTPGIRQAFAKGTDALAADAQRVAGEAASAAGNDATPQLFAVPAARFIADPAPYLHEHFGPAGLVVTYDDPRELDAIVAALPGALTATLQAEENDLSIAEALLPELTRRAGRIVWNGWPTGVAVTHSMQHGGPWPATTNPLHTSVGATAIRRWLAPMCYQDWPHALLPEELRDGNPTGIARVQDGVRSNPAAPR